MPALAPSAFTRYLTVKKTIDDRALNARIWQKFAEFVGELDEPRIYEPGCGIGTMLERLVETQAISDAEYVGIDRSAENVELARARTFEWAAELGYSARTSGPSVLIEGSGLRVEAQFIHGDILNKTFSSSTPDVLLAHAFLDLIDLPSALDPVMASLRPDGIFYFTLVFDGLTILEPEIDPKLDEEIMRLYHLSMDERVVGGRPSGDSRSGRRMFAYLRDLGAELLESGSSDWVVFPRDRAYSDGEFEFLDQILLTIEGVLDGSADLDSELFAEWIADRHEQLRQGELIYVAHQMDFLGRLRSSNSRPK